MKTSILKYTSLIVAAAFLVTACTKMIDKKPEFQLDGSQPLASIEEAENVLTGAYNGFQGNEYYSSNGPAGAFSDAPDFMGDDLIETFESLGNYRNLSEWTYVPNEPNINNTWLNAYNIISTVNIILRDIDRLSAQDAKAAKRIKGQALAIRAHVHFDLLRFFSPTLDRNATQPGVAYVKNFDATAKPARNTVKECYDNILGDLSAAATELSGELDKPVNTASDRTKMDLITVRAIQARVNLYAGQWQDAINAATTAISAKPLSTITNFPLIWTDETSDEVLWAASFDVVADGVVYDNVFFARGNRSSYRPAADLVALYNSATDVRYPNYFANIGNFNGRPSPTRQVVVKHLGKGSNIDGVVNWKAYRTAEMYLIRAEANFKLGKETEARNDLNTLRSNRIAGFVAGTETGTALWNAILTERRKELAFEGHRFFDFKRWNKTPINRCPSNTNSPSTICSLASTSRAWAWPIPFNEIIANPNMVQNQGY